MAGIDNAAILLKSDFQFKGPLAENFVLQQLKGQFEVSPRYYSDKAGEIDFLIQHGQNVIPIEVKDGKEKGASSFKRFVTQREPENAIRFSQMGYVKEGKFTNMPLYLASRMKELL